MKKPAAALATALVALAVPAPAWAHHAKAVLRCKPPRLIVVFDADTGMDMRLSWNHGRLVQAKHLIGRGELRLKIPAGMLSATRRTSVRITTVPALDEGPIFVQTARPCLPRHHKPPPPPPPPIVTG